MKNRKIKFVLLLLLSTALTFAQPNPDALPGEQDQQDLQAPIDSNLTCLVLLGLLFAFLLFQKSKNLKQS